MELNAIHFAYDCVFTISIRHKKNIKVKCRCKLMAPAFLFFSAGESQADMYGTAGLFVPKRHK